MDSQNNKATESEERRRLKGSLASVNSDMRLNPVDQQLLDNVVEKQLAKVKILDFIPSTLADSLGKNNLKHVPSRNYAHLLPTGGGTSLQSHPTLTGLLGKNGRNGDTQQPGFKKGIVQEYWSEDSDNIN